MEDLLLSPRWRFPPPTDDLATFVDLIAAGGICQGYGEGGYQAQLSQGRVYVRPQNRRNGSVYVSGRREARPDADAAKLGNPICALVHPRILGEDGRLPGRRGGSGAGPADGATGLADGLRHADGAGARDLGTAALLRRVERRHGARPGPLRDGRRRRADLHDLQLPADPAAVRQPAAGDRQGLIAGGAVDFGAGQAALVARQGRRQQRRQRTAGADDVRLAADVPAGPAGPGGPAVRGRSLPRVVLPAVPAGRHGGADLEDGRLAGGGRRAGVLRGLHAGPADDGDAAGAVRRAGLRADQRRRHRRLRRREGRVRLGLPVRQHGQRRERDVALQRAGPWHGRHAQRRDEPDRRPGRLPRRPAQRRQRPAGPGRRGRAEGLEPQTRRDRADRLPRRGTA